MAIHRAVARIGQPPLPSAPGTVWGQMQYRCSVAHELVLCRSGPGRCIAAPWLPAPPVLAHRAGPGGPPGPQLPTFSASVLVIAFPGGAGTASLERRARR